MDAQRLRAPRADAPRAPPLEVRFGRPATPGPEDRSKAVRRTARWVGLFTWSVWGGVLLGALLGLGRVPWLEAGWWSLASGAVMGRTVETLSRRALGWIVEPRTLELGPSDPQRFRDRMGPLLRRYGYRPKQCRLHSDLYVPIRARRLLPEVRIAWSGPGAVLEGPRFLLRRAVRLAVG